MKNQNWYPHLSEQVTMLPLGIMTARSHSVGNLATVNFTGTGHWNQLVYYCKIKFSLNRISWRWCWADWKSQKETAQWSILSFDPTANFTDDENHSEMKSHLDIFLCCFLNEGFIYKPYKNLPRERNSSTPIREQIPKLSLESTCVKSYLLSDQLVVSLDLACLGHCCHLLLTNLKTHEIILRIFWAQYKSS